MTIKNFLDSVKNLKTLNDVKRYTAEHLPASEIGTDVYKAEDNTVFIKGEDNANDFAEILEDITGGVALIRESGHDTYARWFTVTT